MFITVVGVPAEVPDTRRARARARDVAAAERVLVEAREAGGPRVRERARRTYSEACGRLPRRGRMAPL